MKKIIIVASVLFILASCAEEKWTESDKKKFIDECTAQAPADSLKDIQQKMCECMLEKIMNKYPSATKAEKEIKDAEMESLANECVEKVLK